MKTSLRTVLKNFLRHYEDLENRKNCPDDQYEADFKSLKQLTEKLKLSSENSCLFGYNEENCPKNRYKDIVPYDFCRVILPDSTDGPSSDYINASYIKGASGAFAYLAAQGPLPNTVADFWKMVWSCNVQVIVMVCNQHEGGKRKCEKYWAEANETKQYGKLTVKFVSQSNICPDFLVRTLLVRQDDESREVWQFHYTTWPDHSIPESVLPILNLIRLVRDCQASETAPILIHCSAGCGRTGTFCAIDFVWTCLRTGKLSDNFCLYDIVADMRRQRIAMVQTKEQYMLVHKAVASLFQHQLNLIDSHTYVNLDEEGEPLAWNSLTEELNSNDITFGGNGDTEMSDVIQMQSSHLNGTVAQNMDNETNQNTEQCQSVIKQESETIIEGSTTVEDVAIPSVEGDVLLSESDNMASPESRPENASETFGSHSLLRKHDSNDSIPFIDEDDEDTKLEVQVRGKGGRAYLHIPSCDSISRIVNRFDPFVDRVACDPDQSSPDSEVFVASEGLYFCNPYPVANGDSASTTSVSVSESHFKLRVSSSKESKLSSLFTSDCLSCYSNSAKRFDLPINDSSEMICSSVIGKESQDPVLKDPLEEKCKTNVERRPSLSKLKVFFEKSCKPAKPEGRPPLFRYHSHPGSRSGSAPPELNSPERGRNNEKGSLFGMVAKKFRSSSVKSEQELRKENASTSNFSSIKRSATTSFSQWKQNFNNLSRTIQLSLQKSSNTCKASIWHDLPEATNAENKTLEGDQTGRSLWYIKDTNQNVVESKKSQRLYRPPTDAEMINQKFIVNVLTSGKQSPLVIGKHPTKSRPLPSMHKTSLESDPTKKKPFMSFVNPLNKPLSPKSSTSFWYENLSQDNCVKSEDVKIPPEGKDGQEAANEMFSLSVKEMPNEGRNHASNSVFYIPANEVKLFPPYLPVKKKNSDEAINSTVVNVPTSVSSEKLSCQQAKSFWPPKSLLQTATGSSMPCSEVTHSIDEEMDEMNSKHLSQEKCDFSASKQNVEEDASSIVQQTAASIAERPALPKKLVIGRNSSINPILQTATNVMAKQKGTKPTEKPVEFSPIASERKQIADPKTDRIRKKLDDSKDLYINVNPITKMNITQIESTLRNHPRGAIIDLTSRQSYSMEEELTLALNKLPAPLKNDLTQDWKAKGYEVIWPEACNPCGKAYTNEFHQELSQLKFSSENSNALLQTSKKSGLCYSPPLRRSGGLSNFSVSKSQSCSSFEWLQGEEEEEKHLSFPIEKMTSSKNSSDALVNVAVVELSTLLDELTTKTLSDDLDLKNKSLPAIGVAAAPCKCREQSSEEGQMKAEEMMKPKDVKCCSPSPIKHYETISFSQPVPLKSDDEIVFHFPPPPPNPPSPENSPNESFDIVCKDGVLHVSTSTYAQNTVDMASFTPFNRSPGAPNVPIPTPRKSKQSSGNSNGNLKKSSSYSILSSSSVPVTAQYENVFMGRGITQLQDALDLTFGQSPEGSSESDNTSQRFNVPHYESIFPHSVTNAGGKTSTCQNISDDEEILSIIASNKFLPGSTAFDINLKEHFRRNLKDEAVWLQNKPIKPDEGKKAKGDQRMQNSTRDKLRFLSSLKDSDTSDVSSKGNSEMAIKSSDSIPISVEAISSQKEHKGLKPSQVQDGTAKQTTSKKMVPAPKPSAYAIRQRELLLQCAQEDSSMTQKDIASNKSPKKIPSRKSERAPDPPAIQKCASLKIVKNLEQKEPIYSFIQKPKLHAVLENISDSQCSSAAKSNTLTSNPLQRKYVRGDTMPASLDRGLQHSQSDASVFLALKMRKFEAKSVFSERLDLSRPSVHHRTALSSESSSDSDSSFQQVFGSGRHAAPMGSVRERVPIAPPRSKRRSTTEIEFEKDKGDAQGPWVNTDFKSLKARFDLLSAQEQAPNVPTKTKEAFEFPEQFKRKGKGHKM